MFFFGGRTSGLVINRFVTIIITNILMNYYIPKCKQMTSVIFKKGQVFSMKADGQFNISISCHMVAALKLQSSLITKATG